MAQFWHNKLLMNHNLQADFVPAKLREHNYRWYIEYHAPERKRPTFGLNRILNLEERRRRGYELCELINWWLMAGLPISRWTETEARRRKAESMRTVVAPRGHTDARRAILYGVELKEALLDNPDSNRSYKSHSALFIKFLEEQGWELMPIDELRRHHIMAFLDHRRIMDKVRNNTVNNNITSLNALFNVLVDRGFLIDNPCEKVKKLPAEPKLRRPLSAAEAKVLLPYIYENDPLLCLAVLMMYCCYMRPKEILRCKRGFIDLQMGLIRLPAPHSKTGRHLRVGEQVKTIPTDFLPYFQELVPNCPPTYFMFGKGYLPGGKEHCQKDRLYKHHRTAVNAVKQLGLLHDIKGLTYYSWKDTGITEDVLLFPLAAVQSQAGHTTPNMTMKYYKKPLINEHLRGKKNQVLPTR
ncbi:MAG: phage integrase N-terminal SAM-like domain-containing protein [Bacteroidota bacterium]